MTRLDRRLARLESLVSPQSAPLALFFVGMGDPAPDCWRFHDDNGAAHSVVRMPDESPEAFNARAATVAQCETRIACLFAAHTNHTEEK